MDEERLTTYRGVRIDDTAEWRLVVYISESGMSAYLKSVENPLEPVSTLFETTWERDGSRLLDNIEKGVYDHPQLLDDFSTEIVICTPHALWVPADVAADPEEGAALYNKVYNAEDEDIFSDTLDGMVCLYTLVPGLRSFLLRTLSGARISCQQTVLLRRFMSRGADMPRVYIDIREGEADFTVLDDRRLLLSATHFWNDPMDIAYHLFNIMDVYGLDKGNTQVSISGERDTKAFLVKELRKHVSYVMLTMMPSAVSKAEMPLAAAMALVKTTTK